MREGAEPQERGRKTFVQLRTGPRACDGRYMRIRPALLLLALALLAGVFASQAGAASVKWRFEVDGQYILQAPAVAP